MRPKLPGEFPRWQLRHLIGDGADLRVDASARHAEVLTREPGGGGRGLIAEEPFSQDGLAVQPGSFQRRLLGPKIHRFAELGFDGSRDFLVGTLRMSQAPRAIEGVLGRFISARRSTGTVRNKGKELGRCTKSDARVIVREQDLEGVQAAARGPGDMGGDLGPHSVPDAIEQGPSIRLGQPPMDGASADAEGLRRSRNRTVLDDGCDRLLRTQHALHRVALLVRFVATVPVANVQY